MNEIELFYNKFNEDKRLKTRHGQVEFQVTYKYIKRLIKGANQPLDIYDIGCGCGAYAVPLALEGHNVTAIDMVKHNIGIAKKNYQTLTSEPDNLQPATSQAESANNQATISASEPDNPQPAQAETIDSRPGSFRTLQRNAMKLNKIDDNVSDFTLLLGPMYHLYSLEDRRRALSEAIRITKPGGYILVGYIMCDYAILMHGFFEHTILEDIELGRLSTTSSYKVDDPEAIYHFVRLEDIDDINDDLPIRREIIFSPDGPANHMRSVLNSLSEKEFQAFIDYQMTVAERPDLLGASGHTVDVLTVVK